MSTPTILNNIEESPQSLLPSPTSPTILSSITPTRIPHDNNTIPTTIATSVSQLMPPLELSLRPRYIVTAQLSLLTKSISVSEYIVYTNNSGVDLVVSLSFYLLIVPISTYSLTIISICVRILIMTGATRSSG